MPLYLDIHEIHGATAEEIAEAHAADLETQAKYGVEYLKYWLSNGPATRRSGAWKNQVGTLRVQRYHG